jgi:cyclic pyranopterin phosphate synthase
MKEIQSEREAMFGLDGDDGGGKLSLTTNSDLKSTAENYLARSKDYNDVASSSLQPPTSAPSPSWSVPPSSFSSTAIEDSTTFSPTPKFLPPGWDSNEWDAEKARDEREVLYGFTDNERDAWRRTSNDDSISSSKASSSSHDYFAQLAGLRNAGTRRVTNNANDDDDDNNSNNIKEEVVDTKNSKNATFSHLTPRGDGIHMVDVGNKVPSRRVAIARSVVIFPPEVLSAFHVILNNNNNSSSERKQQEMIGPKGPIFEIAKIAGIMGAKQTSYIIPLCHPLPLDHIAIDIQLVANQAIIECKCSVTHTTGVEMEALMGASVAALTIYDMVKAVSHNVIIGQTELVSKSGGKSDFHTT